MGSGFCISLPWINTRVPAAGNGRCSRVPGACTPTSDSRQLLADVHSKQPQQAVELLLGIRGQTDILRLAQEAAVCKVENKAS